MENNLRNTNIDSIQYATVVNENKLLRASFSWMSLAMLLTAIAAVLFANIPELSSLLREQGEFGPKPTIMGYVVMFAPLLFVLGIGAGLNRMAYSTIIGLFVGFAIVNGISLSFIFFHYEIGSIFKVFFSTTALFAVMAIAGYTTKTDLTKLGSLLFIALIGIVIASLINFFTKSAQMDYIISILGVIIFTGLTAYDVQKIKNMGTYSEASGISGKLGIMGALTLYLDFINLFLFFLRLFGGRKD